MWTYSYLICLILNYLQLKAREVFLPIAQVAAFLPAQLRFQARRTIYCNSAAVSQLL